MRWLRGVAAAVGSTILVASMVLFGLGSSASASDSHALIQGSGSSWAANAINQWVADVASQGIQVVYTADGDAQGRQDFANKTSDFAVTSIGYQGRDPVTGVNDTSNGRPYAYLPIAAGGTSFPYQIRIDGQQVRNLRLSGETLVKIFTNQITNWDDPEITADNNGKALPSLPIVPVVQSEGSGATAQLTAYFARQYPSIWQSYSHLSGMTEYYPREGAQIAQNGSDAAMNYVSSSSANGSIGYVEYSYALSSNYPVVKMLNSAGYYTLPTQYNVAVALERAQINTDKASPDYLLQNLDNVYVDPDPRTYPLSSYVYMIEPTGRYPNPEPDETTAKRQSIADFEYYSICQGQGEIGPIGYSPLPVNLVEAGFGQIEKLKQADPGIDLNERNIQTCHNPTFIQGQPNTNYLAQIAPLPPACDKMGAGPCAAGVTPNGTGPEPSSSDPGAAKKDASSGGTTVPGATSSSSSPGGAATGTGASPGAGSGSTAGSGTGAGAATGSSATGSSTGGSAAATTSRRRSSSEAIDPATGQIVATGSEEAAGVPQVVPTVVGGADSDLAAELAPLAALVLLLALVVPPVVWYRMARRRREEP